MDSEEASMKFILGLRRWCQLAQNFQYAPWRALNLKKSRALMWIAMRKMMSLTRKNETFLFKTSEGIIENNTDYPLTKADSVLVERVTTRLYKAMTMGIWSGHGIVDLFATYIIEDGLRTLAQLTEICRLACIFGSENGVLLLHGSNFDCAKLSRRMGLAVVWCQNEISIEHCIGGLRAVTSLKKSSRPTKLLGVEDGTAYCYEEEAQVLMFGRIGEYFGVVTQTFSEEVLGSRKVSCWRQASLDNEMAEENDVTDLLWVFDLLLASIVDRCSEFGCQREVWTRTEGWWRQPIEADIPLSVDALFRANLVGKGRYSAGSRSLECIPTNVKGLGHLRRMSNKPVSNAWECIPSTVRRLGRACRTRSKSVSSFGFRRTRNMSVFLGRASYMPLCDFSGVDWIGCTKPKISDILYDPERVLGQRIVRSKSLPESKKWEAYHDAVSEFVGCGGLIFGGSSKRVRKGEEAVAWNGKEFVKVVPESTIDISAGVRATLPLLQMSAGATRTVSLKGDEMKLYKASAIIVVGEPECSIGRLVRYEEGEAYWLDGDEVREDIRRKAAKLGVVLSKIGGVGGEFGCVSQVDVERRVVVEADVQMDVRAVQSWGTIEKSFEVGKCCHEELTHLTVEEAKCSVCSHRCVKRTIGGGRHVYQG